MGRQNQYCFLMNSLTFVRDFSSAHRHLTRAADHRQETGQVAQRQALSGGRSLGCTSLFLKTGLNLEMGEHFGPRHLHDIDFQSYIFIHPMLEAFNLIHFRVFKVHLKWRYAWLGSARLL